MKREIWNFRKSIRQAAKAYTVARQEVAIISSLKHENIVSMIGLTLKPLAIILELAAMGNLKDILTDYKVNTSKLSPFVIQQVCVQISSALVYLHSNRIIYRDLKAENVLAFSFPRPNQTVLSSNQSMSNLRMSSTFNKIGSSSQDSNKVFIKLADYSISRCVLPTGTKGFAGTEGFMAPEIVRFNGEETYSEKVDCFSFGMVLYELFSLKHPFEAQEQIKDTIINGGRPIIKNSEIFNPTLMLDLM
jgi:serine/threonine protein kinase